MKKLIALGALLTASPFVQANAETLLERGTYLMKGVVACGNCHTAKGGPMAQHELAGGFRMKEGPIDAMTPNLTPDKETGIGNWTDAQLMVAIREGKRPDGSLIGPPMPYDMYRGLSDRDTMAIIAYLRNLKPVKNATRKSVYKMPLPPAYGPPVGSIADVPRSDKVAYGAYLAGPLGHCMECHTPMTKPPFRDYKTKMGAGGFKFEGPWGESIAANITPDMKTGLGKWTDAQIKAGIQQGVRADGTKLRPPMAFDYYKNISDDDMDAIVAYLRSLKPVSHAVH